MKELTKQLEAGRDLSKEQVGESIALLLDESVKNPTKADFLEALSKKGETPEEIAAFVLEFLDRAVEPGLKYVRKPTIDICGTGGDKLNMFNVSTTTAFVLAAGGVAVVKHGNRAITSKCGGADVLEALGIDIEMSPEDFCRCVKTVGAGFLFAPRYHPAFAAVAATRKLLAKRGSRSIFNLLGPLLNPVRPKFQLVGVYDAAIGPIYVEILKILGRERAWVCHGVSEQDKKRMDEFCSVGSTMVWPTDRAKFEVDASVLGIRGGTVEDLRGGTAKQNAKIIEAILTGEDQGPRREMVALNASAGFVVAGIATDIRNGLEISRDILDDGRALQVLRDWQAFE